MKGRVTASYICDREIEKHTSKLNLGCLHPVACVRNPHHLIHQSKIAKFHVWNTFKLLFTLMFLMLLPYVL
jgi:hypothetical protein